jgi:hypothetical protein
VWSRRICAAVRSTASTDAVFGCTNAARVSNSPGLLNYSLCARTWHGALKRGGRRVREDENDARCTWLIATVRRWVHYVDEPDARGQGNSILAGWGTAGRCEGDASQGRCFAWDLGWFSVGGAGVAR